MVFCTDYSLRPIYRLGAKESNFSDRSAEAQVSEEASPTEGTQHKLLSPKGPLVHGRLARMAPLLLALVTGVEEDAAMAA